MKLRFACIGLLLVVLFVTAGCVPITAPAPMVASAGDTRGAHEPTETPPVSPLPTPTSPASPLPTPTSPVSPLPTPTSPVSPLAAPTMEPTAQANAADPAPSEQPAQVNAAAPAPAPAFVEYVVRRGDTLAKIGAAHGVSAKAILAANPQVRSADLIFVGQHLKIPTR